MTFITFEEKFNKEQKIKKKIEYEKELHKRKFLFNSKYSNIKFENLKLQNNDVETDDSSTHYLDIETNIIYSYDYYAEEWYISNSSSLKELFD
jgi:hypothetical protein